jgi:hypothetical protein
MFTLLTILNEQRELQGGTQETSLFNELNLRSQHAITTDLVREHLQAAQDEKLITRREGKFNVVFWKLTQTGLAELKSMGRK